VEKNPKKLEIGKKNTQKSLKSRKNISGNREGVLIRAFVWECIFESCMYK
jgi:hypothetical protein